MRGWERFFESWQKDMKLWFFCVSFFLVYRLVFVFIFREHLDAASTGLTVAAAVLNGMRYDAKVATTFMLVPFCFTVTCLYRDTRPLSHRVRWLTGVLFLCLAGAVCLVNIEYYREYQEPFNHYLFGLVYDDRHAIFTTIISSYHGPIHLLAFTAIISSGTWLLGRVIRDPVFPSGATMHLAYSTRTRRVLSALVIGALIVLGLRGSLGAMPARERHAGITQDDFLNKTVLNPFTALRYAIMRQIALSGKDGIHAYLSDGDVAGAVRHVFTPPGKVTDLDAVMRRSAHGTRGRPPRHIFLIVAESYSAWPLTDKYAGLHLSDGLKGLAREGISFHPFIAAAQGTMASLNTFVTGLPDADIHTNYRPSSRNPYPSSLTSIFERLGYRTRFFYGGYLTWQRVGEFMHDQGFDEVHGGGDMGSWLSANEWGLDDEHIFSYVQRTVTDDIPSFNLILTTSFHPPYTVDLASEGFSRSHLPRMFLGKHIGDDDAVFLGHLWYADRCITGFARTAIVRWPDSLVVVTADHPGRRWLVDHPDPLERYLVPCVFFGPRVLTGIHAPPAIAGCHLDIVPTLVELCAPQGFVYHSMGRDLLTPPRVRYAVGRDIVLTPEALYDLHGSPRMVPVEAAGALSYGRILPEQMEQYHDAVMGIAWWRVMKGSSIP